MTAYRDYIRAGELISDDLTPVCPRCAELCEPGGRYCPECGCALTLDSARSGASVFVVEPLLHRSLHTSPSEIAGAGRLSVAEQPPTYLERPLWPPDFSEYISYDGHIWEAPHELPE